MPEDIAKADILIVEDHPTMREAMRMVLEHEGFDIREAGDGQAALAMVRERPPDLLFLDLKGRVAKRLLGLCTPSLDELPDDGSVVPSVVTHADLAALAGGSRENVTRILSELQRRRLVKRDGRRYVLANVQGLRRLAGL